MNWKDINTSKPIAYKSGHWDGLKSDEILVYNGEYHIATMYEGFLDGHEFCDFYDKNDYEIKDVKYWAELDLIF